MWQCCNCDESIEDAFESCWKCGATRDGIVDSDFTPEPDDATVPDPGPDSESDQQDSDLTARSASSGGMNRRELAALICKTLALVLFAVAAVLSVTAALLFLFMMFSASYSRSPDSHELLVLLIAAVPVLAILGVGIFYWKKSNWIASLMAGADPTPVMGRSFTVQDATTVAFSTAGLFVFLDGIREFVAAVYIAHEYSIAASEFWYSSQTWAAIIQLALASWLVLGSRGIVNVIYWCRTVGVRHDDHESEHEDGA